MITFKLNCKIYQNQYSYYYDIILNTLILYNLKSKSNDKKLNAKAKNIMKTFFIKKFIFRLK